jgi:hypothetical protein
MEEMNNREDFLELLRITVTACQIRKCVARADEASNSSADPVAEGGVRQRGPGDVEIVSGH